MKVYLLEKLINAGTSDYDYEKIAICKGYDNCLEYAKQYFLNEKKINNAIIKKEMIIGRNSNYISFEIENEDGSIWDKFYIWITDLI